MSNPGEPPEQKKIEVKMNPTRWGGEPARLMEIILESLSNVPEIDVINSQEVPPQCIAIANEVIGLIDDLDAWDSLSPSRNGELVEWAREVNPRVIFKHQFRSGVDYLPGTISAGFTCNTYSVISPNDLLTRSRPIDVSARMRTNNYNYPRNDLPWMIERQRIVEQAERLNDEGLVARYGKIDSGRYLEELWNTKTGFNWEGFGRLTYRIIEYVRAGVVMITQPLGPEWPVRDDIILTDGLHCVFCDDAEKFGAEAKLLLRDKNKLDRIRRNVIELWNDKLCLAAMGEWYWKRLKQALLGKRPGHD